jgi:hypothetical protein
MQFVPMAAALREKVGAKNALSTFEMSKKTEIANFFHPILFILLTPPDSPPQVEGSSIRFV